VSTNATSTNSHYNAGTWTLSVSDVSGLSAANYDFAAGTNGSMVIGKANLTVTADNKTRLYGAANPTFTQTISGYVNSDTLAVVSGTANGSSAATGTSNVGTYTITASAAGLSADNYTFSTTNGTLTINKAHLTVTAD